MPATTESAPPRTPAEQPDALKSVIWRVPPVTGMPGTATEMQPPLAPALLDEHEIELR